MTRLNLGCGPHLLEGFVNLDLTDGWIFQDGLRDYADGSVEAITVSHALMYVPLEAWPFVFGELARVLEPGGVLRVTEDAADDPASERFGGFHDAVTLTSLKLVALHMRLADLDVVQVGPDQSGFVDESLIQQWHGPPPKVFHIEGVKSPVTA